MHVANNFPPYEREERPQKDHLVVIREKDASWSKLTVEPQENEIRGRKLEQAFNGHL